jgi:hypothetical protein
MMTTIKTFKGLEHRIEWVTKKQNIAIPKYLALSSVGVSGSSALITGCWQYWYKLSLDLT